MMKKYFAESLGAFALVFAGTGSVVINDITGGTVSHVGIALTFGLIVMAMIYSIGDISGAHINPAVTIGFFVARLFKGKDVTPYIACQILGAISASGVLYLMFPEHKTLGATLPEGPLLRSFFLEIILTWLLMFVVLRVSTGSKEKGTMAGIAIGGTVALEALFAGPISGASMNPARSIAPAIISGEIYHLWIYIAAPVLGSILAVLCCWNIKEHI